jgi:hypothetical protein
MEASSGMDEAVRSPCVEEEKVVYIATGVADIDPN